MTDLCSELWRTATRPKRPLSAKTLAGLLVTAALELADVRNLTVRLAALSIDDRLAAERWARAKVAARGDVERIPPMPECVRELYRQLELITHDTGVATMNQTTNRVLWACLEDGEVHPIWITPDCAAARDFSTLGYLPTVPEFSFQMCSMPPLLACDMRQEEREGRRHPVWTGTLQPLTADDWAVLGYELSPVGDAKPHEDFTKPGHETAASHWPENLDAHYRGPHALVARASAELWDGMGNLWPLFTNATGAIYGEALVSLCNLPGDASSIMLRLRFPWAPLSESVATHALGAASVSPAHARIIGHALIKAADLADAQRAEEPQ